MRRRLGEKGNKVALQHTIKKERKVEPVNEEKTAKRASLLVVDFTNLGTRGENESGQEKLGEFQNKKNREMVRQIMHYQKGGKN